MSTYTKSQKKYYDTRKDTPEFKEYRKQKNKEYYLRKKAKANEKKNDTVVEETKESNKNTDLILDKFKKIETAVNALGFKLVPL